MEGFCLRLLVLSFSMASTRTVLFASEGRGSKTCLHWGQLYWPLLSPLSQWLWIQAKQYECPQGRVAGSFRVSRHTEQTKVSSSDQAEAIRCLVERRKVSWFSQRSDLGVGYIWISTRLPVQVGYRYRKRTQRWQVLNARFRESHAA